LLDTLEGSNVLVTILERLVPCCDGCRINIVAAALALLVKRSGSDLDKDVSMVREFHALAENGMITAADQIDQAHTN
jgi:hypothetical protein